MTSMIRVMVGTSPAAAISSSVCLSSRLALLSQNFSLAWRPSLSIAPITFMNSSTTFSENPAPSPGRENS